MRLIQRNLFPRRPPAAKCDGPSVLKAGASKPVSKLSTPPQPIAPEPVKSIPSKAVKSPNKQKAQTKSASLSSLLVIGPSRAPRPTLGPNSNYDGSHDSCLCSTDSSDPSASLSSSCGSVDAMISRRQIVSRSRDALHSDDCLAEEDALPSEDEDSWHSTDKLIEDHIEEIVTKWEQIDDEIWAKVICMEQNRRVAKAYARAPMLTVDGSELGFDGHRIGLNGFANPRRHKTVVEAKRAVGGGVKVKMDGQGNLLARRLDQADVYMLRTQGSPKKLDARSSTLLFDMAKFQSDLLREVKSGAGLRRALEAKCFCFLGFGAPGNRLLSTPVWVILINLVALEMVVKVLPAKIIEDNFYSLPITSSRPTTQRHISSPPKLPPRDLHNAKPPLTLPEPDYDEESNLTPARSLDDMVDLIYKHQTRNKSYMDDDLYYFGLSAHVPKFQSLQPAPVSTTPYQATPNGTTSSRSNPPIVRKKFWSQSTNNFKFFGNNSSSGSNSSKSSTKQTGYNSAHRGSERKIQTLDYRNASTSASGHSSGYYSNPSQFQPQYGIPAKSHKPVPVNDNNEIYGVNTSLLRRNMRQQQSLLQHSQRSISSPSLKHIFSRSKSTKDLNNNRIR